MFAGSLMDRVDTVGVKMGGEFFESKGKDFYGTISKVVDLAVG
jgi:hypothetical protein